MPTPRRSRCNSSAIPKPPITLNPPNSTSQIAVFFNAVRKIGSDTMSPKLPNPTNRGADNPSQFVNDNQNPCSAGQNTQTASTANGTSTKARINGETLR